MAEIKGSAVVLSLYNTTAKAYQPIGCLITHPTNERREIKDGRITKCNPNPTKIRGGYSYQKTFDGVAESTSEMSLAALKKTIRDDNAGNVFWKEETTMPDNTKVVEYGTGVLTELSYEPPADDLLSFSGTIEGVGKISNTDLVVA